MVVSLKSNVLKDSNVRVKNSIFRYLCDEHCMEDLRYLNVSHCVDVSAESLALLAKSKTKLHSLNIDGIAHLSDL